MRTAPLVILASLLFLSTASAITWSGNYLRISDQRPVYYDEQTGQTNAIAPAVMPVCNYISAYYERCGECVYVPETQDAWKSNVSQFSWGRCANVDLTNPRRFEFRADIRTHDGGAFHEGRGEVQFIRDGPHGEDILSSLPLAFPTCHFRSVAAPPGQMTSLSVCTGVAWSSPYPTSWPAPAEKVCVKVASWYLEGTNQYAEPGITARPCRPVSTIQT